MNTQRVLIALTVVNLGLVATAFTRVSIATQEVAPVLRGRALEIVDAQGRVRASITVLPADPTVKMPDGTVGYPETVLLRLRDSKGGPRVKLQATEDGSGMNLGGEGAFIQLNSRGRTTKVRLSNANGREQVIAP